jgi:hypothetical protein
MSHRASSHTRRVGAFAARCEPKEAVTRPLQWQPGWVYDVPAVSDERPAPWRERDTTQGTSSRLCRLWISGLTSTDHDHAADKDYCDGSDRRLRAYR